MAVFVTRKFHRTRSREERLKARQAKNAAAKAAHAQLAKFHARLAESPDFVPAVKASRHGQRDSYWAALHLSSKLNAQEDAVAETPYPPALGFGRGGAVTLMKLIGTIFAPASNDQEWSDVMPAEPGQKAA